ncbi:P-loop containing nucleoside triphosphate hydrolase protein [Scenedesmus sp. NREL 46B-D3]|nr:P-loop containing nucleoside triphosphate hydrolase protein [Scenedesmus sp. NREL 46B-D3]
MSAIANAATYDRWFKVADQDQDGRVTAQMHFFKRSGLPKEMLAKVWELANSQRAGFLDRLAFHKAMDLISIAQSGTDITRDNYLAALEAGIALPQMEGLDGLTVHAGSSGGAAPAAPFSSDGAAPAGASRSPRVSAGSSSQAGGSSDMPSQHSRPPPLEQQAAPAGGARLNLGGKSIKKAVPSKIVTSIIDGLKQIYFNKVRPLEDAFKFGSFFSPLLHESDFEAKPSVLLLGQYSTGKTTFIKYLLGRDYPGCHIGPEPTTDRFVVVQHGLEERRTPGNTLAVQPDKPYQGLSQFGTGFLSRFEGAACPAPLLDSITLIDTPGVLSGEKQRIERNYQFIDVCEWFATRSDLILLLFDPYKLDISDEFKQVISTLRGHDDKVRIILNKSDQVDQQQLMRVYGALMWSLGKVFKSPEVCKVYIGSFNSEGPIDAAKNPHCVELFEKEQAQLLHDLYEIPSRSCDRKVNEFVKRVRAFRIHLLIMGHLRKNMPAMFGKDKAQRKLLDRLPDVFFQVQREYHLPAGDFPDVVRFRDILSAFDFAAFPKMSKSMVKQIDDVLSIDVPNLVRMFDNPYQ